MEIYNVALYFKNIATHNSPVSAMLPPSSLQITTPIRIGEQAAPQPLSGTRTVSRLLINGVAHSFFIRADMKKAG